MAKARQIDPRDYIEPGTGFQQTIGYILFFLTSVLGLIVVTVASFGIALIPILVGLFMYFYRVRIALAQLRGSALKVGPKQFPEIYEYVAELADAIDMDPPDVYIVESAQQNAFATKIGAKKNVVLFDSIVNAALQLNKPDLLRFIIGHELAHHALGHTGLIRSQVSMLYKPLSRSDELSCDAVGAALVGEQAGKEALTLLLIGPHLFPEAQRGDARPPGARRRRGPLHEEGREADVLSPPSPPDRAHDPGRGRRLRRRAPVEDEVQGEVQPLRRRRGR